ncbi:acetyl-CoA acetyltransferase [Cupriavidus pauculus]|uniref:acetyl-CoA acetyltransferase n=1 Tax=Cupriavidus pauculus TaxID=82633 RepID=UPI001EE21600|nr:acetyl-CoA acetyltransferase [Cupriavidus pauculus]GJG96685.1 acetyl-CoA acetyltransferase [Cupriavidus pauculus]
MRPIESTERMDDIDASRVPVIVGVGEWCDRPTRAELGLDPLTLMAHASRAAAADAFGDASWQPRTEAAALLGAVDSLDIVCEVSWPYANTPELLTRALNMHPARAVYGPIGGETPVRFVHEAAQRIARGASEVALVVGAEAEYTVGMARKADVTLPWPPRDDNTRLPRGKDFLHALAVRHGVATPATVYPLFENLMQARAGQRPAEGNAQSAALWSRYATVAACNPHAWIPRAWSAEEIGTPSPENRLVAWPYTKRMIANPMVNQGAAVLMMSLARARAAGIDPARMIHIRGGAAASEPRDYLRRAELDRSHAQEAVLRTAMTFADAGRFTFAELYSCFPVVPKLALRVLGDAGLTPTVTGGLSFFGAPLNNYMTHAVAAMVRALRGESGATGLVYGQGEYLTKHHAIVLASEPSTKDHAAALADDYSVQASADARQAAPPPLAEHVTGTGIVETYTVLYGRDGTPDNGVVVARTATGERTVARVPRGDGAAIGRLLDTTQHPVGARGVLAMQDDGLLDWQFA